MSESEYARYRRQPNGKYEVFLSGSGRVLRNGLTLEQAANLVREENRLGAGRPRDD
jgi:hypothetical protein